MFYVHGWKGVARDALLIYIFSFALGFLVNAFWELPTPPSSQGLLLNIGIRFSIGIVSFALIGMFTKEIMWKHLFKISVVLILYSTVINYFKFQMQMPAMNGVMLFTTFWIPFVHYSIALIFGGTIAFIIIFFRSKIGAAS